MHVIAIDWSGAADRVRNHLWLAEASQSGRLVRMEPVPGRSALARGALELLRPEVVAVGLDFAFSLPAWFVEEVGANSAPELWAHVERQGEAWLAACAAPFWGRPGRRRPVSDKPSFRRTELAVPRTGGIGPKSVFQIGGAGAVGTGSIRGMPLLRQLHEAGATIWPFVRGARPIVVEIYPRLLTGPVRKSVAAERQRLLAERYPTLDAQHRDLAMASEDAFDAAVSALVMAEHVADLLALPDEPDPQLRLEGRIWHPRWCLDKP